MMLPLRIAVVMLMFFSFGTAAQSTNTSSTTVTTTASISTTRGTATTTTTTGPSTSAAGGPPSASSTTTVSPTASGVAILQWYHIAAFATGGFIVIIATCYVVFMWQHNELRKYRNAAEQFLKEVGAARNKLEEEVARNEEERVKKGLAVGAHFDYEVPPERIRPARPPREQVQVTTNDQPRRDKDTEAAEKDLVALQRRRAAMFGGGGSIQRPPSSLKHSDEMSHTVSQLQRRDERELTMISGNRDLEGRATLDACIREGITVHRNLDSLRRGHVGTTRLDGVL